MGGRGRIFSGLVKILHVEGPALARWPLMRLIARGLGRMSPHVP